MTVVPDRINVSVITCAWNAERHLAGAIESALLQHGTELEVIVIDDHSTDRTFEVAHGFALSDPRVRAVRLDRNLGPAGARNVGLELASGEWIALLDADDRYHYDRLFALLDVAREWNADMVADNLWLVDGRSGRPFDIMLPRNHLASPRLISASLFVQNNMPANVKRKYGLLKPMIRRDFIERNRLRYDEDVFYGEDFLFYLECLLRGARFVLDPKPHYYYTLSRGSVTQTRALQQAEHFLERCDQLLERTDVRSAPRLVDALTCRSFQLRSDLVYLQFASAVKQRRIGEALKLLLMRPDAAPFVMLHLNRAIALRARQLAAGIRRSRVAAARNRD